MCVYVRYIPWGASVWLCSSITIIVCVYTNTASKVKEEALQKLVRLSMGASDAVVVVCLDVPPSYFCFMFSNLIYSHVCIVNAGAHQS